MLRMRHFDFLDEDERSRLFFRAPETFSAHSEAPLLATALGATLYCPATRPRLAEDIASRTAQGLTSAVVCLEDAIRDVDLVAGERNAIGQLRAYAATEPDGPLLFVRVRSPEQIPLVVDGLGEHAGVLTGFVLPKFTEDGGTCFLAAVEAASTHLGRVLYAMPVIESRESVYAETRVDALIAVRRLLDKYRRYVLAVRLGATDMAAPFGLRRSRDHTVYDVGLLAAAIAEAVNVLARDDGGYLVTGPVWEYFSASERIFKPQLRESPFIRHDERKLRAQLIADDLDGLIREVTLDRVNGLVGKTVIHPDHVAAVHALSVVSHEEYLDATDILGTAAGGGAASSAYRNKMNESKPHTAWARRTELRARVFGVARDEVSFVDFLAAGLRQ